MKKFLFIAAAFAGMLFVTSCANGDDPAPTPPTPFPGKTYLQTMKEDLNTALAEYPEFKKQGEFEYPYGYFCEAKYTLNGNFSEVAADELKAVKVEYGFSYNTGSQTDLVEHVLMATRDFTKGADEKLAYTKKDIPGAYPSDLDIIEDLDKVITLEHALMLVKQSNVIQPKTKIVRFRRPPIPGYDFSTVYRFDVEKGSKTVVFVNAITGEVKASDLWPSDPQEED